MRKFLLMCSIILLCTNTFGAKRSKEYYKYNQTQPYTQKSDKNGDFKNHNRPNYETYKKTSLTPH